VFLDEKFEEFKHAKLPNGTIYSESQQEDIKEQVKNYLDSKKAYTVPLYLFMNNHDEDNVFWNFL
jgi:hypothetical protein